MHRNDVLSPAMNGLAEKMWEGMGMSKKKIRTGLLLSAHYTWKGTWKHTNAWKPLNVIWIQYCYMCESEIMKSLVCNCMFPQWNMEMKITWRKVSAWPSRLITQILVSAQATISRLSDRACVGCPAQQEFCSRVSLSLSLCPSCSCSPLDK